MRVRSEAPELTRTDAQHRLASASYSAVLDDILDYAGLSAETGKKALDCGCGPGPLTFRLGSCGRFDSVIGADPSHVRL